MYSMFLRIGFLSLFCAVIGTEARADELQLLTRHHDPFGAPRPAPGQKHVPLRTTIYVELGMSDPASKDVVLPESVAIELEPEGGKPIVALRADRKFTDGFNGRFLSGKLNANRPLLAIYIEPERPLRPETTYTIRVTART